MQLVNQKPIELLIRPGGNDHQVIADLLAPGAVAATLADGRPVISRLVLDAHAVSRRTLFVQAAASAGIPCLIDPLTPLLQGELRPGDRWASLPFGRIEAVSVADLASGTAKSELVADVVDFEVEAGATAVLAPYLYAAGPEDPWFELNLDLVQLTYRYMEAAGIRLPLVVVQCGQLQSFGNPRMFNSGLDRITAMAIEVGASAIALCLSPAGAATDGYHKVLRLFLATERMLGVGIPVFAWRQGIYGPGLTAIGVSGYETGIATSEQTNIAQSIANRRPQEDGERRTGGAVPGVFLEPLGRSVPTSVAQALLGDLRMRAKVMCDDEGCCPLGPTSTLDHRREHAIRARARALSQLDEMPQRAWRLHRIARDARGAATLIGQANRTLAELRSEHRLNDRSATALADVAAYMTEDPVQEVR